MIYFIKKGVIKVSRGRRYEEPKLNMKKVFAVIIAIIVFIRMKKLQNKENKK